MSPGSAAGSAGTGTGGSNALAGAAGSPTGFAPEAPARNDRFLEPARAPVACAAGALLAGSAFPTSPVALAVAPGFATADRALSGRPPSPTPGDFPLAVAPVGIVAFVAVAFVIAGASTVTGATRSGTAAPGAGVGGFTSTGVMASTSLGFCSPPPPTARFIPGFPAFPVASWEAAPRFCFKAPASLPTTAAGALSSAFGSAPKKERTSRKASAITSPATPISRNNPPHGTRFGSAVAEAPG
ncbi:MAG TPA: hypothetical protein VEI97_19835 [bacterium]|nr:hypothetical protein [bacterium]